MPTLGLYLHIPFCKSKCAYCDFYSLAGSEARMDDYTAALARDLCDTAPRAQGYTVDTVYFGGGTPSYLGGARLVRLLDTVRTHYALAPDAEITLEANPDSADEHTLRMLRAAGFDRLSLGMQCADDATLRSIGRIHTHAQTVQAVQAARAAGFDNVSLDLIYGLPRQTLPLWRESLQAALALAPQHLSCYGLKVEEGTPLARQRSSVLLPDDDAQAAMYLETAELLAQSGYEQYEISNFACPGYASRHNLRYWQMQEYLGFGPGAHSDFGGERFARARSLERYLRGASPDSERSAPLARERTEELVMLSLRTAQGLSLDALAQRGLDTAALLPFFRRCAAEGLAQLTQERFSLTPRGFLVSNAVIVQVLELLGL